MTPAFLTTAAIYMTASALSLVLFEIAALLAPLGWQDADGFHVVKDVVI